MPRQRKAAKENDGPAHAPAVVLLFPNRKQDAPEVLPPDAKPSAKKGDAKLPKNPATSERPTLLTPRLRGWLKIAIAVSVVLHLAFVAAFYLRNEDDLARASGAAASASSDGAIVMEVDVIVNTPMQVAAKQTHFTKDAKQPVPTAPQQQAEPKPQPKQAVAKVEAAQEAPKPVLTQDEIAPPKPVETAPVSEAPKVVIEEKKPKSKPKELAKDESKKAEQKTANVAPSAAANPNRSASSGSQGTAGARGVDDAGGRAAISSYQAQVLAHLQRHRVYPPEAQSRGITGIARVRFSLASNGSVIAASLAGTSGATVLDQAAVAMVRRASPFPAFPAAIQRAQLDFAAPIRFDIR
jgi:periplasmic protein TonB